MEIFIIIGFAFVAFMNALMHHQHFKVARQQDEIIRKSVSVILKLDEKIRKLSGANE